jgi:type I restriction enzyme M protein
VPIADHQDQLITQSQIGALAGVARATVTLWRREPGFPPPERGGGIELFRQSAVLAWLDDRPVPRRFLKGGPDGTTYGARVRKAVGRATDAETAAVPVTHSDAAPSLRPGPGDEDRVRKLMGAL